MRPYLPLAPLLVVASVASANACSDRREAADRLRVVPPPAVLARAEPPAPPALRPAPPVPAQEAEPAPSAEEVREFERTVPK
jgi:hypothetical protein